MVKVGEITHYFSGIGVAVVKIVDEIKIGDKIHIKGTTTDFEQTIDSMQVDRKPIMVAKKGDEIGLKVVDKVRPGDEVFKE